MKTNTLLTVYFLLMSLNTFSQPLWTKVLDAKNHNKSTAIGNALLGDSIILQAGYAGHSGYFLPSYVLNSLFAFDLQGNILWHVGGFYQDSMDIGSEKLTAESLSGNKDIKSPTYSPGGRFELISVYSDQIYAIGYQHDFWFEGFLTISKFDKNGELIVQNKHSWENPDDFEIKIPVTMDVYEGMKILIGLQDNTVVKTDSLGQVVWLKSYEFNIKQVGFINENRFYMMTAGNLYLADMEGNILDSVEFEDECLNSKVHNNTIFQLFSNKLIRLDSDLNILDTTHVSHDITLKSIKTFHDNLWLMGLKDQEIKMIKIENLTASDSLTFDLYVESPDFLIAGSQFVFTGTSKSGQIAVYSYDIEEEPENYIWPNIEIVDFNVSNIEYEYDSNDPVAIAFRYDTEMTIYNNSDDIIESFAVFTYLLIGVEGQPFFYNIFTDQTINPFEEITFSLPRLIKYDRPSHNNEFCFEILAPNSKIEPDISKNNLCKTFDIVGIAQEFAPIGAKWHYSQGTLNPNLKTFKTIECTGDTLINGIDSRILIEVERITTDTTKTTHHYFSSRNDSVFFFKDDQFHLLYDFGAMPGDTITLGYYFTHEQLPLTMIIDSLSTVEINGHQRTVQHITSGDGMIIEFGRQVISGIGSTSFLFPTLDFSMDGPLRCYSDNNIGVFLNPFDTAHWGGVDCEEIITNIKVVVEANKIKAYPNPAVNMVTIMNLNEPAHFRIFNIFGQVKSIGALDQNYEINLNNLSDGVYFIELNYNNQRTILKVLKGLFK